MGLAVILNLYCVWKLYNFYWIQIIICIDCSAFVSLGSLSNGICEYLLSFAFSASLLSLLLFKLHVFLWTRKKKEMVYLVWNSKIQWCCDLAGYVSMIGIIALLYTNKLGNHCTLDCASLILQWLYNFWCEIRNVSIQ